MYELIHIRTECYSGYKADETPRCFLWQGTKFEVKEVLDRWYQWDSDQKHPVSDYFKVETSSGDHYILKHDLENDKWFLCKPDSQV